MIELPPNCPLDEAATRLGRRVCVWATASVEDLLRSRLPWPVQTGRAPAIGEGTEWLLVAGGGTLIDKAKVLRLGSSGLKLAALATIWGSGAEASPIAVLNGGANKIIRVAPELRPDLRITEPAFGATVPSALAKDACGDCWSHALEGFLSPLASDELRADLAVVIERMMALPPSFHRDWFELSALASAGQAKSSVGLVHGIAHVMEGRLREGSPEARWSHAKLCTLFLLPVMRFNAASPNGKWKALLQAHGLGEAAIWPVLRALHDAALFQSVLPALAANWRAVLRDPCSRTNSAFVRPDDLAFFESFHA